MCAVSKIRTRYTITLLLTYRRASQSQHGQSGWGRTCRGWYNRYCCTASGYIWRGAWLVSSVAQSFRLVEQIVTASVCANRKKEYLRSLFIKDIKGHYCCPVQVKQVMYRNQFSLFFFLNCLAELPVKSWCWLLLLENTHTQHGTTQDI